MPRPLRIGMIGCGAIAEQHLRAATSLDDVAVVGVCDLSPVTAEWMAERFTTTPYVRHTDLLEQGLDVVHVLTPPSSHVPLARDALAAGAHVLVEKPIAADAAEAAALLDDAAAAGRRVVEHQNYRFNDEVLAVGDLLASGRLGDPLELEVRIALDVTGDDRFANASLTSPVAHLRGGVIRDFLPHMAGLVVLLLGEGPVEVRSARWSNRSGIAGLGADVLDARAETAGGVTVGLSFSAAAKPECFRILLRGTAGLVEVDLFQPYRRVEVARGPQVLSPLLNLVANGSTMVLDAGRGLRSKVLQRGTYHGVPRFLDGFYDAVRHGGPGPLPPDEVLATARLVDALAAGASEGPS